MGNQDPTTAWPNSLVMLSAIAAATSRVRLVAAAVIAPLRHPLLLAKELATLDLLSAGRLVVQPTVSWFRPEYEALGVPWAARGDLLDEHLAAWEALWGPSPASFDGRHYPFTDVYLEPKPFRPGGPTIWLGGVDAARPPARSAWFATATRSIRSGQPTDEDLDAPPRGDDGGRPGPRRARDGGRHARRLPRRREPGRRRTARSNRFRRNWNEASGRSASSRRSSPTTRRRSAPSAARSSTACRRARRLNAG